MLNERGGEELAQILDRYVPGQNVSLQNHQKPVKMTRILLIFLDFTYNPWKNLKFYSLQGQNVPNFLLFTNNQGKIVLILPITRRDMYTWSPLGVPPVEA